MRILVVRQGKWGERIAGHLQADAPAGWEYVLWSAPPYLPAVIDEPRDYLPAVLPAADLLLALTEGAGLTDLVPDLARLCGAAAVILPVDRRSWALPGLRRQVRERLAAAGVAVAMPMPFCSLAPTAEQHPLIVTFGRRYGRPELVCTTRDGHVAACDVRREAPCGSTRHIAAHLPGVPLDKAAEQAGLLHHYYPCWGGMEVDPVHGSHTLLHLAATMAQKSVERTLKRVEFGSKLQE